MNAAAEALEFEKAADYRDKLAALRAVTQKQKIVSDRMANQDIAAFACYDDKAFIDIFFVRSGRVTGRRATRLTVWER